MTQESARTDSGGEVVLEARVRRGQLQKELEDLSLLLTGHGLSVPLPGPEQPAWVTGSDCGTRPPFAQQKAWGKPVLPASLSWSLFLYGTALLGYRVCILYCRHRLEV